MPFLVILREFCRLLLNENKNFSFYQVVYLLLRIPQQHYLSLITCYKLKLSRLLSASKNVKILYVLQWLTLNYKTTIFCPFQVARIAYGF